MIIPLVLIGSFADRLLPYPLPWGLSASFVGLGLYFCGNLVRRKQDKFSFATNMPWWACILSGIVATALISLNGYINMRNGIYSIVPLFWINAVLSMFIGISISKLVEKLTKGSIVEKWLVSIGRDSIVYLCFNQLVIIILSKAFDYIPLPAMVERVLILAVGLSALYILNLIFTKTKLRVFRGK